MMDPCAVAAKAGKARVLLEVSAGAVFTAPGRMSFRQNDPDLVRRNAGVERRRQPLIFGGQEKKVGAFLTGGAERPCTKFGRQGLGVLQIHSTDGVSGKPRPWKGLPEIPDHAVGAIVISTLPA